MTLIGFAQGKKVGKEGHSMYNHNKCEKNDCGRILRVSYLQTKYSRTSITRTSMGPC